MIVELLNDPEITQALDLLSENALPTTDLPKQQVRLFGISENNKLTGCVGIEVFGESALLRSLATSSSSRGKGLGKLLTKKVEAAAKEEGVKKIFLLTETAENFFKKMNYSVIERDFVPDEIKQTTEFSELCPSTAVAMQKTL